MSDRGLAKLGEIRDLLSLKDNNPEAMKIYMGMMQCYWHVPDNISAESIFYRKAIDLIESRGIKFTGIVVNKPFNVYNNFAVANVLCFYDRWGYIINDDKKKFTHLDVPKSDIERAINNSYNLAWANLRKIFGDKGISIERFEI